MDRFVSKFRVPLWLLAIAAGLSSNAHACEVYKGWVYLGACARGAVDQERDSEIRRIIYSMEDVKGAPTKQTYGYTPGNTVVAYNTHDLAARAELSVALAERPELGRDGNPSSGLSPNDRVFASNGGVSKLSDYRTVIPRLLNEQNQAEVAVGKFAAIANQLAANHESLAATSEKQVARIADTGRNLNSLDGPASPVPVDEPKAQSSLGSVASGGLDLPASGGPAADSPGATGAPTAQRGLAGNFPGASPRQPTAEAGPAKAVPEIRTASPGERAGSPNIAVSKITDATQGAAGGPHSRPKPYAGPAAAPMPGSKNHSLRDALRAKLAGEAKANGNASAVPVGALSGAQEAVSMLLAKGENDRPLASAAYPGFPSAGKNPEFSMNSSETEAAVRKLTGEDADAAAAILGAEAGDLFVRVHVRYQRLFH
jgi:hypothetical protein